MAQKAKSDYELALNHQYITEHGRHPAVGVTTVINLLEKPALKWGAARIAAKNAVLNSYHYSDLAEEIKLELKRKKRKKIRNLDNEEIYWTDATDEEILIHYFRGSFQKEWDIKSDLGTRVHDHAENLSKGRTIMASEDVLGHLQAWQSWFDFYQPEFIHTELVVLHPNPFNRIDLEYGGRFDWIARLHGGGSLWEGKVVLGDYKTGSYYPGGPAIQAAAYLTSKGMGIYDLAGNLIYIEPLPKIDAAMTLYLHSDGTYDAINPFNTDLTIDLATKAFFNLRSLYNFQKLVDKIS